jgi:hypothetical protein
MVALNRSLSLTNTLHNEGYVPCNAGSMNPWNITWWVVSSLLIKVCYPSIDPVQIPDQLPFETLEAIRKL